MRHERQLETLSSRLNRQIRSLGRSVSEAHGHNPKHRFLYHGTLAEYEPEIRRHGLQPKVGSFRLSTWGKEVKRLRPLVFLTDRDHIRKAMAAIVDLLEKKLGVDRMRSSRDDVRYYGMLVEVENNPDILYWDGYGRAPYASVEPGDYFSTKPVEPRRFIKGKELFEYIPELRSLRSVKETKRKRRWEEDLYGEFG